MGHPNEDLLRQGYDAFGRGDMEWLNEHFADDIVWHVPGQNPFAGDHRGKEAVFALFAKQMELTGGSLRLEIHDVLANDEHGVALATVTATREGKSLQDRQAHVFHVQGRKVTEFWSHPGDQRSVDEFLA
jgi:ketosteroid isomerase-like protein